MFLATIISRLLSLLASWIALQFIDNTALGIVLFSYNIILFILPISGLGLPQSLIRFSALNKNKKDRNSIFLYVLKYGLLSSFGMILLIIISSFFISFQFEKAQFYIRQNQNNYIESELLEIETETNWKEEIGLAIIGIAIVILGTKIIVEWL